MATYLLDSRILLSHSSRLLQPAKHQERVLLDAGFINDVDFIEGCKTILEIPYLLEKNAAELISA